jgi:hypothetical protein
MLVDRKVAATLCEVSPEMITYLTKRGYVKKHFTLGNNWNYQVDLDEVKEQLELGQQRRGNKTPKAYRMRKKDGTFI